MASPRPNPIDWGIAQRVAVAGAGAGPPVSTAQRGRLRRDLVELTASSHAMVREFSGLESSVQPGAPALLDRAGWIRANVRGLRALLAPLDERLAGVGGVGRRAAGAALGLQLGLILGYVSRKVLGQYDLFLAPEAGGAVYFVGPNIIETERRAGLAPRDFRLWIALHEVTHRTQFGAVPWLREYVMSQVGRYLSSVDLDVRRLRAIAEQARDLLRAGPRAWGGSSIARLLLTGEQRDALGRLQALMCVVEGHGNFVMDGVGAERIRSYSRMKRALAARRAQGGGSLLEKAIGIELKYEQYALGERFMAGVAGRAGIAGVNRVWEREENLPTMGEIRDPAAWIERVRAPAG
ncbi:MAG: zinc-dependent metalloprotease [Acidobacteria bacterium]|nr:zinc-dependent metalloprotease [Acidobacteriota bacterium]